MQNLTINHLAVFVCALLNLGLGALWYSPALFHRAWLHASGLEETQLSNTSPLRTYGLAFILAWLCAYNLAFFLGDAQTTAAWGAAAGFLAGLGFAAFSFAIIALFEQRSWKYILINGGFITTYFTLIGLILGIWR